MRTKEKFRNHRFSTLVRAFPETVIGHIRTQWICSVTGGVIMLRGHALTVCLLFSLTFFEVHVALAQTNLETNAGIQFNFSTPGAHSLALGRAFLALADDATTAYTNPAGLTNIFVREVHIEARHWTYTHVFTDRGRLEGDPTMCLGKEPIAECPDTIGGLRDGEAEDQVTGLSFLSIVFPHDRWSLALYRHELANFEANFSTQGAYLKTTRGRSLLGFPGELDGRLASLRSNMKLDIVNHGVSGAYNLIKSSEKPGERRQHLSIGLGLSYSSFSLNSITERFLPGIFEFPDFDSAPASIQTQVGDDNYVGVTAGFLWKSRDRIWSIGGVYRQGISFEFNARSQPGEGSRVDFGKSKKSAMFHVPDVYGLGISFKPTAAIRISLDYDYVKYSDMTRGFVDIFNLEEIFPTEEPPELDQYKIDDGEEYHLGVEYSLIPYRPLIVRLGTWRDPDHSLRFEGSQENVRTIFKRRGDQIHYTAGVGIPLKNFQVDIAFDYSKRVSTGSFSMVVQF